MDLPQTSVRKLTSAALKAYPSECCGFLVDEAYISVKNKHPDPTQAFAMAKTAWLTASKKGTVRAILHSHTNGNNSPSAADMEHQAATGVPWYLVITNGSEVSTPWGWGDTLDPPPLIGRPFRHGPSGTDGKGDCYALIRDWYRENRGTLLRDFPRNDEWWMDGLDLYRDGFSEAGFRQISIDHVRPGDVFLATLPVTGAPRHVPTHGGIVLDNNLILHHLPGRLSRRDPISIWRRLITHILRYGE